MEDAALHCGVNEKAAALTYRSPRRLFYVINSETAVSRACGKRLAIPYKFPRRQAHVRSPQHTLISAEGDTAPQCGGVHCTRVRYRRS
jgi:hypothetical protein